MRPTDEHGCDTRCAAGMVELPVVTEAHGKQNACSLLTQKSWQAQVLASPALHCTFQSRYQKAISASFHHTLFFPILRDILGA